MSSKESDDQTLMQYLIDRWLYPTKTRRALFWHAFVAAILTQIIFVYFFWVFNNIPIIVLTFVLLAFSLVAFYQRNEVSAAVSCSCQLFFLIYLITCAATKSITPIDSSPVEASILIYAVIVTCILSSTVIIATLSLALSLRIDVNNEVKEAASVVFDSQAIPEPQTADNHWMLSHVESMHITSPNVPAVDPYLLLSPASRLGFINEEEEERNYMSNVLTEKDSTKFKTGGDDYLMSTTAGQSGALSISVSDEVPRCRPTNKKFGRSNEIPGLKTSFGGCTAEDVNKTVAKVQSFLDDRMERVSTLLAETGEEMEQEMEMELKQGQEMKQGQEIGVDAC